MVRAPAMPAMIPDTANPASLTRVVSTEADWAARSLFSAAIRTRPARDFRNPIVIRIVRRRNDRQTRYIVYWSLRSKRWSSSGRSTPDDGIHDGKFDELRK